MNRYSLVLLILYAVIAAMSVWKSDWNWLIVMVIGIAVVCAPMRATGDRNTGYDQRLMGIAVIPLVAFIVLFTANLFLDIQYYYPASIAIQAGTNMALGMMIAVIMNARTEVSLSRRWTVMFALTFATGMSMVNAFSTVYWMSITGFPLHNDDFTNTLENNVVNMMLMLPMAVTTFATIVYAVVLNRYLKRVDPLLSRFCPGGRT
ncbi:MAG: hypothetical protein ISF22_11170 [Methanomassiliicoccus sp.]|nr:hypothetical protein [Methanomassiliicoccus sp.]